MPAGAGASTGEGQLRFRFLKRPLLGTSGSGTKPSHGLVSRSISDLSSMTAPSSPRGLAYSFVSTRTETLDYRDSLGPRRTKLMSCNICLA